jgi:chromosomal replication initiation ATPase DnaA
MGSLRVAERRQAAGKRWCRSHTEAAARQVIDPAVGAVFEVAIDDLRSQTRGSPGVAFARQVAMYLAHVVCGFSLTEVGALFARDRTTVSHACSVVEDRRDDPELDRRLEHLERAVAALIDALFVRRGRS